MPYFTLAYGHGRPRELAVGKALLLPDDDASWQRVIGEARPRFLDIFRRFPELNGETLEVGEPTRGTLVTSDDAAWLEDHLDSLSAVVFLLATTQEQPLPAECFTTYPFHLKRRTSQTDDDCVGFFTKFGQAIESSQVLQLTPPLAVRARLRDTRLITCEPWAAALLRLFAEAPDDRRIVAVRQYFRTQFSDLFTSPVDEDFALHCSAIEAALGVTKDNGGAKEFAKRLASRFNMSPRSVGFFRGLYVTRSRYVHGVGQETPEPEEVDALSLFRSTRRRWQLLRAVTRHVIQNALAPQSAGCMLRRLTRADQLLRECLDSDSVWQRAKKLLTKKRAAERIIEMPDEAFAVLADVADELQYGFCWLDVQKVPSQGKLCDSLRTCGIVVRGLAARSDPVYEQADHLEGLAKSRDVGTLTQWILSDPWRGARPTQHDRLKTMQSMARSIAKAFDRSGMIRD